MVRARATSGPAITKLALYEPPFIVEDNDWAEVAKLKRQPGRDILVVGSSALAQTLMQHDL